MLGSGGTYFACQRSSSEILLGMPCVQLIYQNSRLLRCCVKNVNQMSEQCFPNTELKLVRKVDNDHSGNVKFFSKPLKEGLLSSIQQDAVS